MRHIIRMLHRLTDDKKGVYVSCEENGNVLFVSDLKENGRFYLTGKDGARVSTNAVHLFRAYTQEHLLSFIPDVNMNMYSGIFVGPDNVTVGNIIPVGTGSDKYYVVNIYGHQYECYKWTVGTAPCMMFYKNGVQKAMLVEDKLSVNQMYSMTMHIADDEDILILCMLGLIYHQFENVENMNSRFHRAFIRNGWSLAFCENVSNYHFEVLLKGAGKSKYNINFLKQFYPKGSFPYEERDVSAGTVMNEMKYGLQKAGGEAFTKENLNASLKNPLAIFILVLVPLVFGIIGGFLGNAILTEFGSDNANLSSVGQFLIGFLVLFLIAGIGEGIFILFFKWITSVFDKKK